MASAPYISVRFSRLVPRLLPQSLGAPGIAFVEMALAAVALVVALPHRAAAGAPPASRLRIPACSIQRCGSVVALLQHCPASAHRAAGPVMNAYDDYAGKIKEKLESLDEDETPVVPMVPARGNDGIGGRDRSKVRAWGTQCSPVDSCRPCRSSL